MEEICGEGLFQGGTYGEENGKESLVNEIEVMRQLNHKNLMRMFGVY